ncbi:MAG: ATP-dependent zinc metalloprotease FtsH [Bacteroidetes bacterium]|nr:ATP-dependent zinc metalloprotease FtsH [Bacteroidota bacterium]
MEEENNKSGSEGGPGNSSFYWIFAVVTGILLMLTMFSDSGTLQKKTKVELTNMVETGEVKRIMVINKSVAEITLTEEALASEKYKDKVSKPFLGVQVNSGPQFIAQFGDMKMFEEDLERWNKEYGVAYDFETRQEWGRELLQWVLLLGVMIAIWVFVMRKISAGSGPGGQIFNIGKSRAKIFDKGKGTNVTFNDVAGLEGAKEEIEEIVDFLRSPKKYTELGAKIPKGALLVGPPGTGKTLLAKAVAGEAQVPFFSLSGSDFVEMFVGVGASRVRDLFKQAKEKAPAIIFIDEIDAIGRARGKNVNMGSNDERENTLNQLLTEMDGFGTNSGVIILAATNRADILDRALMRAGRFDRQIFVDMPDLNERQAIFKVHLKPIKVDDTVNVEFLAKQTPGFSGADIANICNEAALIAARKKKISVGKQDFLDAVDRIIGGLEKKNKIITPKEKEVIAFHEAGHATVSWLLEHASPLVKVTIVPRGQSLGAAWYLPEERQITTTEQLLDEMCAALGGRAAEEIVFGKISTGALSDLEKVTKQAYAMVTVYGMDEKLGNISYYDSSGQSDYSFSKPYSEKRAEIIDTEVSLLIEKAYARAKDILSLNKDKLTELAHQLVKEEVIFKEDLEKIFGMKAEKNDRASVLHIANEKKVVPVTEEKTESKMDESGPAAAENESNDLGTANAS